MNVHTFYFYICIKKEKEREGKKNKEREREKGERDNIQFYKRTLKNKIIFFLIAPTPHFLGSSVWKPRNPK